MVIVELKFMHKRGEPMYIRVRDGSATSVRAVVASWRMWKGSQLSFIEREPKRSGVIERNGITTVGTWEVVHR